MNLETKKAQDISVNDSIFTVIQSSVDVLNMLDILTESFRIERIDNQGFNST